MKNHEGLNELFISELENMYSSEAQIVEALPKVIQSVSLQELKDALNHHLKETQHQLKRIEQVFSLLELEPSAEICQATKAILHKGEEFIESLTPSPVLDAAIISTAQKIEHHEIASYGTLRSFAKQLNFDSEILDLLKDTLDEEIAADKKLTKIAEGSIFFSGVNREAATTGPKGKR